jgi:3-oxoadipate enol-lactonase
MDGGLAGTDRNRTGAGGPHVTEPYGWRKKMRIKANGIEMNYELSGKEGASLVVLSHSLGSNLAMWEPQMDALRSHYRVLRYDTRGHGDTQAPVGPYSFDLLAKDAIALMDALHLEKAHWVGLSMGGMIGQTVALNHPDRLTSLALCDTAAALPPDAQSVWTDRIRTAREEGLAHLVDGTMERWFTPSYLKRNPPEVKRIREIFMATPVDGYIGCSEAIRRLDHLERLHRIDTPTLILVGSEDQGTPVSASEAMKERIPNAKLYVIPSAAHLSNIEQAEVFNRELLAFLKAN